MSVFSAISMASSTSMPRYLTVLSIFVCPSKSWTARRLPVRRKPAREEELTRLASRQQSRVMDAVHSITSGHPVSLVPDDHSA